MPGGTGRGWDVGYLGSWVRLPWLAHDEDPGPYITIPQYWFNKTKQHTHTLVNKMTMGLEHLCADLRRHPVKAHTRHWFQDPLLTWFVLAPKSVWGGTLEAGAAYRLYPKSTSAKNPHHSRQLSLIFDVSCMGPKSFPITSDEYHSQDLVHGIEEKLLSTDKQNKTNNTGIALRPTSFLCPSRRWGRGEPRELAT